MRAAALLRCGGGPESPDWPQDPFTLRPIGCRVEKGAFKLWCGCGTNRGAGRWDWPKRGEDLVLEGSRR